MNEEYISVNDALELLNITRMTLYRWAKIGKLPIYKQGRKSLVKRSDAERVKKENEEIKPLYDNNQPGT